MNVAYALMLTEEKTARAELGGPGEMTASWAHLSQVLLPPPLSDADRPAIHASPAPAGKAAEAGTPSEKECNVPVQHAVQQGECLSSIAARYGFSSAETIYDHPANAEFKRKRPNPNLIFPGDVIVIPDRQTKVFTIATGKSHAFTISRPRRVLRLALENADRVRMKDTLYTLKIAGCSKELSGATNSEGILEQQIPVDAEDATVVVEGHEWPIKIAHLNPVDDTDDGGISGIQARLRNMGCHPGEVDGVLGPKTEAAIRAFQAANGLTVNGQLDANTCSQVVRSHGC